MTNVWEAVIPIGLFVVLAFIVKIIVENSTRKKLINKGLVDENIKYLFPDRLKSQTMASLKWGMVCIAIGLAVFVGQMFGADLVEEVTIGAMFVLAGLALVLYYPIASRMLKKSKEEGDQT